MRKPVISKPTKGQTRRPPGALESEVLGVLWVSADPLTPGQVQAALTDQLTYSTVLTILLRLLAKGLLERTKVGRAYAYRPVQEEADLAAERMRGLLERGSDHTRVLQRFVDSLSAADERILRQVVATDEN